MASELPATAIGAFVRACVRACVRARAREQFNDVRSCSCISADRNGIVTRVGRFESVCLSVGASTTAPRYKRMPIAAPVIIVR